MKNSAATRAFGQVRYWHRLHTAFFGSISRQVIATPGHETLVVYKGCAHGDYTHPRLMKYLIEVCEGGLSLVIIATTLFALGGTHVLGPRDILEGGHVIALPADWFWYLGAAALAWSMFGLVHIETDREYRRHTAWTWIFLTSGHISLAIAFFIFGQPNAEWPTAIFAFLAWGCYFVAQWFIYRFVKASVTWQTYLAFILPTTLLVTATSGFVWLVSGIVIPPSSSTAAAWYYGVTQVGLTGLVEIYYGAPECAAAMALVAAAFDGGEVKGQDLKNVFLVSMVTHTSIMLVLIQIQLSRANWGLERFVVNAQDVLVTPPTIHTASLAHVVHAPSRVRHRLHATKTGASYGPLDEHSTRRA